MRALLLTLNTLIVVAATLFVLFVKDVKVPLHVNLDKRYYVLKVDTLDAKIKHIYYLER